MNMMDTDTLSIPASEDWTDIRDAVGKLCEGFPNEYWNKLDKADQYPTEFVETLTESGFLGALIPEEFGGSSLPLSAAAAVLETIHERGCNAAACHAQMYTMGTVLKYGSPEQKQKYLPAIASGELRLQAFGGDRAQHRQRHHTTQDPCRTDRKRLLYSQRAEGLDQSRL